nr:MAG TPA: hypothetical protein [Caudoviricetes sp.]
MNHKSILEGLEASYIAMKPFHEGLPILTS